MLVILGNLAGMMCDGAKYTCALTGRNGLARSLPRALIVMAGHHPEASPGTRVWDITWKTVNNMVAVSKKRYGEPRQGNYRSHKPGDSLRNITTECAFRTPPVPVHGSPILMGTREFFLSGSAVQNISVHIQERRKRRGPHPRGDMADAPLSSEYPSSSRMRNDGR